MGGKPEDIIGKRQGMLVTVRYAGKRSDGATLWVYRCDCGKEVTRARGSVERSGGLGTNCGCTVPNRLNGRSRTPEEQGYSFWKGTTPRDTTTLSYEEWLVLVKGLCTYCGAAPVWRRTGNGNRYLGNGIDCVDSTQGYIPSNCTTSCDTCNKIKNNMTLDEFEAQITRIYQHMCAKRGV